MKNVILTNMLLTGLVLVLITSCKQSTEPQEKIVQETENKGLLPLKVGNIWEYQEYSMNSDGTIRNILGTIRYSITKTVSDPQKIILDKLYKMRIEFREYITNQNWIETDLSPFLRNYSDGLYIMGGVEKGASPDSIYLKIQHLHYPVKKGDKWRSPGLQLPFQFPLVETYLQSDTTIYHCVETDSNFETPLGAINCIVYYHRFQQKQGDDIIGPFDVYEYYNEKYGLIGCITKGQASTYKKQVLISTNLLSK